MPLSRVRLRIAGWFAVSFLLGLLILSLALYSYFHLHRTAAYTETLAFEATGLARAVQREYAETPVAGLGAAARAAVEEWPAGADALVVYDSTGARIASVGPEALVEAAPERSVTPEPGDRDVTGRGEHGIRLVTRRVAAPLVSVTAAGSLVRLDEDAEALALWLAVTTPVTLLLSLLAGYSLSRRALRPVGALAARIANMAPEALDQRLPVSSSPDEIDRVAVQFNALLERLQESRDRNRQFLAQAAHQIRTPLTLVLGEADLALGRPEAGGDCADALQRVRMAAIQMQRRVEDLIVLAHAESGDRVSLSETIELDGLAFEAMDRMRARAQLLERRLELGELDAVAVRGSGQLLQEAVIELLENACRHGGRAAPIRLEVRVRDGHAVLTVSNAPPAAGHRDDGQSGHGLGLQVVAWIAAEHGGRLEQSWRADGVVHSLVIPVGRRQAPEAR